MEKDNLKITVHNCARCGGDHIDLEFAPFLNPVQDTDGTAWTYWGVCPATNQPILLKIQETQCTE